MESKCILVEGIKKMKLEIKATIDAKPEEINGDGKYDEKKSFISFSKIENVVKNDFFYCRVIQNNTFFKNEKETNYRLCSLSKLEKNDTTILIYNHFMIYFTYKVFSIEIKEVIVTIEGNKAITINKDLKKNKDNSYKLEIECPLNYIKENETFCFLQFKITSNEDVTDFREYKVYLSPKDIKKHKIVLLNSEINIKDSCFTQLTTQIFTCSFIEPNIIKLMYDYKIKYVLFDKQYEKQKNDFMERLNSKTNRETNRPYEIQSFILTLNMKNYPLLKQKIDYFVKDKIDNILIYNYYSLVSLKNFDIKKECEYLNTTIKEEEKDEKVE